MATFQVDPNKVADLTATVLQSLQGRRVHIADITIALTEALGRTIVAHVDNPLAMRELATVAAEHLERTIRIGAQHRNISMGDV